MDRKEFLERVSSKTGAELKEVEQVFQKFLELTTTALRDGEKVSLAGFGTFFPKITKAVKKFSAILNREIEIPEKFTVAFSSASKIADEINIKYKDEKPKVIKEAVEREIEKRVPIMPPEQEEDFSKAEKLLEEISKLEESEVSSSELKSDEEVSLSSELLEALKETEPFQEEKKSEEEVPPPEFPKQEKEKKEVSTMPEMNLNQEKPKFTYGEDLSTPTSSGSYQQSFPSSSTSDAPGYREKESSGALWVTLIVLLIGIIGIGIYWAVSSDVTETKKEPAVTVPTKETTPPVVVEKKPKVGKKEIIIAPEEFATIPSDTSLKQQTPLLVEETKKETPAIEKKQTVPPVQKTPEVITEKQSLQPTITSVTPKKQKPISRRVTTKTTTVSKSLLASTQGDYFIQVNSYSEKRFADNFARELRNKGYRAFVESADHPNLGKVYRVKVGFYNDEDAAAKDYHSLRLILKKEDIYVDRR